MANGEWGMANGEWGMGNGEWRMGNGELDEEWAFSNAFPLALESADSSINRAGRIRNWEVR